MWPIITTLCIILLLQPQPLCSRVLGAAINTDQPHHTAPTAMDFSTCYDSTLEQTFSDQRLNVLQHEILSKLNIDSVPNDLPDDFEVDAGMLASYQAAVALNEAMAQQEDAQERQDECREKETFYAKEVKLYFPASFVGEVPSVDMFDWGPLTDKRDKRSKEDDDDKEESEYVASPRDLKQHFSEPVPQDPKQHFSEPVPEDPKELTRYVSPITYSLTFSDIDIATHTPVWSAQLRLYKRKIITDTSLLKRSANPMENVEVHRISHVVGADGKTQRYPVQIVSRNIRTEEDEYVSFDITEGIREWLRLGKQPPQLELEVVIRCPESVSTGLSFLPTIEFDVPSPESKGMYNAQLAIKILVGDTEKHNRSKRQSNQLQGVNPEYCLANPSEINCCVKESTINFREDLGWTWVVAPRTFKYKYCRGLCPRIWPSGSLNTEYLNRLRVNNPTSSPEPCCVAQEARPLTVLIYDGKRLHLSKLEDMLIDSCQCR